MFLVRVTLHVDAPELAAHHTLSHALDVCVSEQALGEVDVTAIDAVMELDAQLPRQIVVTINQPTQNIR